MRFLRCIGVLLLIFFGVSRSSTAAPIVIDFETLTDSEIITTQFPGLTFTNGIALSAGISLNEFEFPPYSGFNVASDDLGPLQIDFASPVDLVGGYFTYLESITLQAFNPGNTLLGSVSSAFSSNLALSGDAGSVPNEFLTYSVGVRLAGSCRDQIE